MNDRKKIYNYVAIGGSFEKEGAHRRGDWGGGVGREREGGEGGGVVIFFPTLDTYIHAFTQTLDKETNICKHILFA